MSAKAAKRHLVDDQTKEHTSKKRPQQFNNALAENSVQKTVEIPYNQESPFKNLEIDTDESLLLEPSNDTPVPPRISSTFKNDNAPQYPAKQSYDIRQRHFYQNDFFQRL
jgi:hypothetical protein